ncbi:MAG: hypothetical protein JNL74_05820 [Fibrobacteres bacterium]|nr:hypothetical protein [Fibrobacterota bacterium]
MHEVFGDKVMFLLFLFCFQGILPSKAYSESDSVSYQNARQTWLNKVGENEMGALDAKESKTYINIVRQYYQEHQNDCEASFVYCAYEYYFWCYDKRRSMYFKRNKDNNAEYERLVDSEKPFKQRLSKIIAKCSDANPSSHLLALYELINYPKKMDDEWLHILERMAEKDTSNNELILRLAYEYEKLQLFRQAANNYDKLIQRNFHKTEYINKVISLADKLNDPELKRKHQKTNKAK